MSIADESSQGTFPMQNGSETSGSAERTTSGALTLSAGDSLARTSARPGTAPESTESRADFGARCGAPFASFDRDSSSWRTSQLCLSGEQSEYSETWPRAGLMRNG